MQQQERDIPGVQIINRCESTAARKKASLTKERRTQGVGSFAAIFGIQPLFNLGRNGEDKASPLPSSLINYCSAKFPSKRIYTYAYGPCYRRRTVVFFCV